MDQRMRRQFGFRQQGFGYDPRGGGGEDAFDGTNTANAVPYQLSAPSGIFADAINDWVTVYLPPSWPEFTAAEKQDWILHSALSAPVAAQLESEFGLDGAGGQVVPYYAGNVNNPITFPNGNRYQWPQPIPLSSLPSNWGDMSWGEQENWVAANGAHQIGTNVYSDPNERKRAGLPPITGLPAIGSQLSSLLGSTFPSLNDIASSLGIGVGVTAAIGAAILYAVLKKK